jgi:hypothetical protein
MHVTPDMQDEARDESGIQFLKCAKRRPIVAEFAVKSGVNQPYVTTQKDSEANSIIVYSHER